VIQNKVRAFLLLGKEKGMYFLIAWHDKELVHLSNYATEYSYMRWLHKHVGEYTGFKVIRGSEIDVILLNVKKD